MHKTIKAINFQGSPGNLSQFEDVLFSNNEQIKSSAALGIKFDTKTKVLVFLFFIILHTGRKRTKCPKLLV